MFFTPPSCLWDREIAVDHRSLTGNGGGRRALLNKTGIAILREIEGGRREERAGAPKKIPPPSKKGGGGERAVAFLSLFLSRAAVFIFTNKRARKNKFARGGEKNKGEESSCDLVFPPEETAGVAIIGVFKEMSEWEIETRDIFHTEAGWISP